MKRSTIVLAPVAFVLALGAALVAAVAYLSLR